ncbi:hypothetical protein F5Y18DRAFT_25078 [Xylariaceae sp. FL1019]|nr:hypothetical protein F5Y18DRAFT_25078 [Xylariaceae sp. FL1019]
MHRSAARCRTFWPRWLRYRKWLLVRFSSSVKGAKVSWSSSTERQMDCCTNTLSNFHVGRAGVRSSAEYTARRVTASADSLRATVSGDI